MSASISLWTRMLLGVSLICGLPACSKPEEKKNSRSEDNVLEEYVKVPLDKAKSIKQESDDRNQRNQDAMRQALGDE